ncbi:MAG: tRNA pseudouridine(38-40) synthase TruA [Lachnospiraceae bacterium]|nr:tRNA pseudouridine(38-40) synthase TruA [Lachnospiraceae bacterium]
MLRNYKLEIMYDGSRYKGWEHQPGTDMTIQGKLENVLKRMTDPDDTLPEDKVPEVIGAGRTDAGVHARAMIANVRLDTSLSENGIRDYMNEYLPDDICVTDVRTASDRFHSRYNATGKTYRYTCFTGGLKPVFDRKYVYVLDGEPDLDKMRKAASLLVGEHDFASFCSNPKMKKSTVRRLDRIDIEKKGRYIYFTYHGSGFLQHMVRILTGTILETGFGLRSPESMSALLEARERAQAGFTAPPQGLCLMKVDY